MRKKPIYIKASKELLPLPSSPQDIRPIWKKIQLISCFLSEKKFRPIDTHTFPVHTVQWSKNQITNTANLTFTPHLTLKMTTDKVVETSVNNNKNTPFQDYTNLDDLYLQTCKNKIKAKEAIGV